MILFKKIKGNNQFDININTCIDKLFLNKLRIEIQ